MRFRSTVFCMLIALACAAQEQLPAAAPRDTSRFRDLFTHGRITLHARSVYMTTINEGVLKDDYAHAAGIGLGLNSGTWRGFQCGVSGFVTYNLWSSDLTAPDPSTLMPNRYELGLFDIAHPAAKDNLFRIENLFLRYTLSKSALTVGRMKLVTPFLNPQDGRMNTSMEEGAWLTVNESKKFRFSGGWFWGLSPRSTVQWYPVSKTFGLYPSGVSVTGAKSNYLGHVNTSGIALANASISLPGNIGIDVWDMLVDNVMNSAMISIRTEKGNARKVFTGLMYIHQDAIHDGGNANQAWTYMHRGSQSNTISGQAGIKTDRTLFNVNLTHITGDGRYLAPREWGSDPLFTFMAREKNDGFGKVLAVTTHLSRSYLSQKLKLGIGYGYFHLPDVKDYRVNKYGIPSYHQVNGYITYNFTGFLKGFNIWLVSATKIDQGNTYSDPRYVYNKVDMSNITLTLDYNL